jgi:hypothetical protein
VLARVSAACFGARGMGKWACEALLFIATLISINVS